ncbi:hypothetical protein P7C70_g8883, partial [Phenoliferia sp. Uapishka_3]
VSALPPPRFLPNGAPHAHAGAPAPGSAPNSAGGIKFWTSPFWRIEKVVGAVKELSKAPPGARRQVDFIFSLFLRRWSRGTKDLIHRLHSSRSSPASAQYQLRLFSTSEDYYNVVRPSDNSYGAGAPIDFPGTCESIKLNSFIVTANTKGIKKKLGSAPPVDLSGAQGGTALKLQSGVVNKVEVVYSNTEKRFYMAAFLVEVTSVKQVVERIKKGKFRSKEDVIASIVKQNSDPDVVATAQGLSLKDPLVGSRIKTPIRSSRCEHIGCFDAEVFFMMNEQTPAWACPICSKVLNVDDITVDGYFESILSVCPSSIEAVTVEPDGTWRSSDDKHGTAEPKGLPTPRSNSTNGSRSASVVAPPVENGKGKGRVAEALTIDSDDDSDSAPVRRASGSAVAPSGGVKRPADTIDLTGDSDDEEPAPPNRPIAALPRPPTLGEAALARQADYRNQLVRQQQAADRNTFAEVQAEARRVLALEDARKRARTAAFDAGSDSDENPWGDRNRWA